MSHFVDQTRVPTDAVRHGLAIVGTTPEAVVETLGSLIDGSAYLAGSLAVDLGNRGSDIDILMFTDDEDPGDLPMMFFVNQTILDVQFFRRGVAESRSLDACPSSEVFAFGRCATDPAPPARFQKRLSRWVTAAPFFADDCPPLLSPAAVDSVQAVLVRGSLENCLRLAAIAELAGGRRSELLWQRAARQLLEVAVRSAGDLFVGDKWLSSRARRVGIDDVIKDAVHTATDGAGFARACTAVGLPPLDASALVALDPNPEARPVTLGSTDYTLVGGRLHPVDPSLHGHVGAVIADGGGGAALAAIRNSAIVTRVDADRLLEVIR